MAGPIQQVFTDLRIVHHGYDVQASTAFFPVYPLGVRLLGSSMVVATLLSLVAAGVGAVVLAKRTASSYMPF